MNKIIQDIKPLKAAVGKALGEGSVVGCEVTYDEIKDDGVKALMKKHFNMVAIGNELRAEGQNIIGFIIWGNIDKNSWLQTATYIGGGATSQRKHFPMLFDDNYQAKPAYWAFVNPCIEQNILGN